MLNRIRHCVAVQMEKYCDLSDWQSVRQGYFIYSYVSFLVLAANKVCQCDTLADVLKVAREINLEDQEVLSYIEKFNGVAEVMELIGFSEHDRSISLQELYQLFIANDFTIENGKNIVFSNGKNGRDILGAYYTSEKFAYEITKKVFTDYKKKNGRNVNQLTVIDNSCGAGEFLIAAIRNISECITDESEYQCIEKNIYGYDVDPIAVIIARLRIMCETKQNRVNSHIRLGNPLILENGENAIVEKFVAASKGRFYSEIMAIGTEVQQYDIVLGNPPWEKVRFEEKKFLRHFCENEEDIENREKRKEFLERSKKENRNYYKAIDTDYSIFKKYIKQSEKFQYSSCGEINTYALFTELSIRMMKKETIVGLIVKASLLKMPVYKEFMKFLMNEKYLYDVFMFVNRNKIFNIDSREEFSVICLQNHSNDSIGIGFNLDKIEDFDMVERTYFSAEMLQWINPETSMIPAVKNKEELEFLLNAYNKNDVFGKNYADVHFGRLVHFTNHAQKIKKNIEEGYIPVYEGKFIEQYNARFATFAGMTDKDKYRSKASAVEIESEMTNQYPEARYFIEEHFWNNLSKNFTEEYIIAWRSLTAATNKRTMLATVLPKMPTCQSLQIMQCVSKTELLNLLALFNSIIFDYIVRLKMVGLDLTQTIIKQMPVPAEERFGDKICFKGVECSVEKHIHSRIRKLYIDDYRMDSLFEGVDVYDISSDISKKKLIYEIDLLICGLYGIKTDELKDIARTFTGYYCEKELEEWF